MESHFLELQGKHPHCVLQDADSWHLFCFTEIFIHAFGNFVNVFHAYNNSISRDHSKMRLMCRMLNYLASWLYINIKANSETELKRKKLNHSNICHGVSQAPSSTQAQTPCIRVYKTGFFSFSMHFISMKIPLISRSLHSGFNVATISMLLSHCKTPSPMFLKSLVIPLQSQGYMIPCVAVFRVNPG